MKSSGIGSIFRNYRSIYMLVFPMEYRDIKNTAIFVPKDAAVTCVIVPVACFCIIIVMKDIKLLCVWTVSLLFSASQSCILL